jgi:protein O-GlcNAc transferase
MENDARYLAAFESYKAGRLDVAERCCRQLLEAEPNHADALHLLGLIAYARGGKDESAALIGRAIDEDRLRPTFHNSLGNVFKEQGKLHEAAECYRRALAIAPATAPVLVNLGNVLHLQGMLAEAIVSYQKAIEAAPPPRKRPFQSWKCV